MPGINALIAQGGQPVEIENPMNALARVMQLKTMQQEAELGQMKMDEYRRGVQQANALQGVMMAPGFSWDDVKQRKAAFAAAPTKAESLYKSHVETTGKLSENEKRRFDMAKEGYNYYQREAGALFNDPAVTKEKVAGRILTLSTAGVLRSDIAQAMVANLPDDQEQLRIALRDAVKTQLTPEQMLTMFAPKPTEVDTGQQKFFRDMNPNSPTYGQTTGGAAVQKMQSPDAILQAQTSEANNRRSVGAQYDLNRATREAAATQAQATRDAAAIKDRRDTEMKLADDYQRDAKAFGETSTAMRKVMTAIETADKNPGAALAAGTGFMKLLDPTSVVRETELGMALNASGWFDRATNIANTLQSGRIMTPTQKQNLKKASQDLFEEAKAAQREIDVAYKKRATDYGLDAARIIVDRGQNAAPVVDLGSLPPGGGAQPAGRGNAPVKPRELQWGK